MKTELKAILTAIVTNVFLLLLYFGIVIPADLIPLIVGTLVMLISAFINPAKVYSDSVSPMKKSISVIGSWAFWIGLAIAILTAIYNYLL